LAEKRHSESYTAAAKKRNRSRTAGEKIDEGETVTMDEPRSPAKKRAGEISALDVIAKHTAVIPASGLKTPVPL